MTDRLKVGIAGYGVVGKRRRVVIDALDTMVTACVSDRVLDGDGVFDKSKVFADKIVFGGGLLWHLFRGWRLL